MLCGHGAKIPFLNIKGRYNACVMHHIWIPYSSGFVNFQIDVFCVFI